MHVCRCCDDDLSSKQFSSLHHLTWPLSRRKPAHNASPEPAVRLDSIRQLESQTTQAADEFSSPRLPSPSSFLSFVGGAATNRTTQIVGESSRVVSPIGSLLLLFFVFFIPETPHILHEKSSLDVDDVSTFAFSYPPNQPPN
uniref:Uncharacterized protein n=1 Tax=Acrobeloides nanus TaxID=290746 RepID=A0A914DBP8_9BILA